MGAALSCTSKGSLLIVHAANGDIASAQELLKKHPHAALYHNFKDRSSPLIQAAARGHFELLQLVLEAAVMIEGPEKAKRYAIDHANSKKQTALMVACKHGHPDCVEYLVTNGADPLVTDARRHNTCLHFAALYGHSDCAHKLLGSRTTFRQQVGEGRQVSVAQIPCHEDEGTVVRFIDRHNGWGLTALHIALFQGSVNTVRALLRHGASLESVINSSKIENSPIRCSVGSNALHIASLIGNISMVKVILEAQESIPGLELRSRVDAAGLRPQDYAQRARNPVLVHLLDPRLPVALLRQIWMNYSLEQSVPPRHQTLAAMLQKLKLMFNLEIIALCNTITAAEAAAKVASAAAHSAAAEQQAEDTAAAAAPAAADSGGAGAASASAGGSAVADAAAATAPAGAGPSSPGLLPPIARSAQYARSGSTGALPSSSAALHREGGVGALSPAASADAAAAAAAAVRASASAAAMSSADRAVAAQRVLWQKRLEEMQVLLTSVSQLHSNLEALLAAGRDDTDAGSVGAPSSHEAVLEFILSTLITPRTVSAIVHAAKKLVCSNVMAAVAASGQASSTSSTSLPPTEIEVAHGVALLTTALRAVETCLQASAYTPFALAAAHMSGAGAAAAAAAAAAGGGPPPLPLPIAWGSAALVGAVMGPGAVLPPAAAAAAAPAAAAAAGTAAPGGGVGGDAAAGGVAAATAAVAAQQQGALAAIGAADVGTAPAAVGPAAAAAAAGEAHRQPDQAAGTSSASASAAGAAGSSGAGAAWAGPGGAPPVPSVPLLGALPAALGGLLMPPLPQPYGQPPPALPTLMGEAGAAAAALMQMPGGAAAAAAAGAGVPPLGGVPFSGLPAMPPGVPGMPVSPADAAAGAAGAAADAAAAGAAPPITSSAHWSAHLHSLIAQLHWDIGVQRHRRRRQHAAAQATRNAQAAARALERGQLSAHGSISAAAGAPGTPIGAAAAPIGGGASSIGAASPSGTVPTPPPFPVVMYLPLPLPLGHSPEAESAGGAAASASAGGAPASGRPRPGLANAVTLPYSTRSVGGAVAQPPQQQHHTPAVSGTSLAAPEISASRASTDGVDGGEGVDGLGVDGVDGLGVDGVDLEGGDMHDGVGEMGEGDGGGCETGAATRPQIGGSAAGGGKLGKLGGGAGLGAAGASTGGGTADEDAHSEVWSEVDDGVCSICMDQAVAVQVSGCQHGLCVLCAFQLTVKGRELPICPFCRKKIPAFEAKPAATPGPPLAHPPAAV
ncbi:hypothetical protein FOA52_015123 [Chlamydomonas sp. UWO 241]|nr:hypothetical protein FOA52_015123 [Chlamydomonas sp. UWO 241]